MGSGDQPMQHKSPTRRVHPSEKNAVVREACPQLGFGDTTQSSGAMELPLE